MSNKCRFYENKYPQVGDDVVVKITKIEDFGATGTLLEYNVEGMVTGNNISRRKIKSIRSHLKVNKQYVLNVVEVDEVKGYVDLSKKYVTIENEEECTEFFNKAKRVNHIIYSISRKLDKSFEKLMELIAWPLYDQYDHAIDGLTAFMNDPTILDLEPETHDLLLSEVKKVLGVKPRFFTKYIELQCFTPEGIDAIKYSLNKGKILDDGTEIDIKLHEKSTFALKYQATDKNDAYHKLDQSIKKIKQEIEKRGGELV
jgi:translation initiation factor 2 subunit 1